MDTWQIVLATGVVSIVASLSTVLVKGSIDRANALRERRSIAYRQFGSAVNTFLTRADAWNVERSFSQSISDSILGFGPFGLFTLFHLIPKRWRPNSDSLLEMTRLIRIPEPS